jgi:anthranilate phosphoribosyltransferase
MDKAVRFLKIIGNGPKSHRDYTEKEAFALMEAIMEETVFSEAQLGALWLMMRNKTTTKDELMGILDAWETKFPPAIKQDKTLLLGNPFDGKKRSVSLSPFAACLLEQAGNSVYMGGVPGLGPKFGNTEAELFANFNPAKKLQTPTVWNANTLYPFYKSLIPSRNEIGLRSFMHTIEKCINPFGASHAILTLHHEPYIERFIHLAQTRFDSATLVFGEEGSCDLCLRKPTRYIRVTGSNIEENTLSLEDFPLKQLPSLKPGTIQQTVYFWKKALTEPSSDEAQWIIAQTALLLFALGQKKNLTENITQAHQLLLQMSRDAV